MVYDGAPCLSVCHRLDFIEMAKCVITQTTLYNSLWTLVRLTHLSRPNKVGLKCPSVCTYVHTSVRPQKL